MIELIGNFSIEIESEEAMHQMFGSKLPFAFVGSSEKIEIKGTGTIVTTFSPVGTIETEEPREFDIIRGLSGNEEITLKLGNHVFLAILKPEIKENFISDGVDHSKRKLYRTYELIRKGILLEHKELVSHS